MRSVAEVPLFAHCEKLPSNRIVHALAHALTAPFPVPASCCYPGLGSTSSTSTTASRVIDIDLIIVKSSSSNLHRQIFIASLPSNFSAAMSSKKDVRRPDLSEQPLSNRFVSSLTSSSRSVRRAKG
jgi:hypothetical protein